MHIFSSSGRRSLLFAALVLAFAGLVAVSCRHTPPATTNSGSGYPAAVAKIIVNKCATAGCHNSASGGYAADLRLDTWDQMLRGSSGGAVVVPYNEYFSTLLHFINTDTTLGHVSTPRMPANGAPLSREEYLTLRSWILSGAPSDKGEIPFSTNAATRQKIYMTQQGCDQLAVVDAQRGVVMRYVTIGSKPEIESPHCVRVSADGSNAYVSFLNGDFIQKINCTTDEVAGSAKVSSGGSAQWNILQLSPDGSRLMAADFKGAMLTMVRTSDMTVIANYNLNAEGIQNPHGIAASPSFDTFYVTLQNGNTIYKFTTDGGLKKKISLDGAAPNYNPNGPNPHEIMMTPDGSKYFVTCEGNNKVVVVDAHADTVIQTLSAGLKPQEIAMSRTRPYVFVTCMEDPRSDQQLVKGSVYVYNYNTLQQEQVLLGNFFQPHAVTVDEQFGRIYVVSTNFSSDGPAPHHVSLCGGRNGWYSVYDLNTLQPYSGRKYETSVYPYSADARFK